MALGADLRGAASRGRASHCVMFERGGMGRVVGRRGPHDRKCLAWLTLSSREPSVATVPDRFLLELLREQAEGRRKLEEKFARTLEVADAAGIAIPQLAEASGLTLAHPRQAAATASAAARAPVARRRQDRRGPRAGVRGRDRRRRARRLSRIPPLRRLYLPGGPGLPERSSLLRFLRRE